MVSTKLCSREEDSPLGSNSFKYNTKEQRWLEKNCGGELLDPWTNSCPPKVALRERVVKTVFDKEIEKREDMLL